MVSGEESDDISLSLSDGEDDLSLDSSQPSQSDDDNLSSGEGSVTSNKLTARQRSIIMAETMSMESSPSLESMSALPRELTEEEQLKKSEKSRRRKHLRDQKLEQSKADTIQRLLQKQSTRSKKMRQQEVISEEKAVKAGFWDAPVRASAIRLTARKDKTMAMLGKNVPSLMDKVEGYPKVEGCAAKGCGRPKKYAHSKLGIPICSLECYRLVNKAA